MGKKDWDYAGVNTWFKRKGTGMNRKIVNSTELFSVPQLKGTLHYVKIGKKPLKAFKNKKDALKHQLKYLMQK